MKGIRLLAICAILAGLLQGVVTWWNTGLVGKREIQHSNSNATLPMAETFSGHSHRAEDARINSEPLLHSPESLPKNLIEAIARAQATSSVMQRASSNLALVRPTRGMSAAEARKVFKSAVRFAQMNKQTQASSVSPFE